jgi:valyl-tRNA synthetase
MDKTFNPAEAEPRIARLWDAAGAFRAGAGARPGGAPFSIVIPPPNVTGALHMGHAFNSTLQDILVRWRRMKGDDVLWQPGTDHAGIATQMVVERELALSNRSRSDLGRDAFLALVWEQKTRSRGNIRAQLERLGCSCDWSREAFTMGGAPGDPEAGSGAPDFHAAVLRAFVELHRRGLISRGQRLVNWDPQFETAISDLEVETREVQGFMWHFKYPLANGETYEHIERDAAGEVTRRETRDYIAIATTRPETMLGDGAVAVHPSDARYAPLVGRLCEIPVGPKAQRRLIPIIADEHPDPAFGSGAVKITGAHDFDDHRVALRHGIPLYVLMDSRGRMRSDGLPYAESAAIATAIARGERPDVDIRRVNLVPDELRGLDRFEARRRVVARIEAEGLSVMTEGPDGPVPFVEARTIMQPFGDRSGVVIEPMLTDQWFVDTARLAGPAIDAVRDGRTTILPERDAKVYFHWLETIEPWCISRQIWWGHRIPVWYGFDLAPGAFRDDQGDGALDEVELLGLLLDRDFAAAAPAHRCGLSFAAVAEGFRDEVADLPAPLNLARVVEVEDQAAAARALAQGLADYNLTQDPTRLVYPVWRDADVLDTWFSSGIWPIGTLGWPEDSEALRRYFPTSVLVTGFDIIFFWVARMMMMQLALVGEVPFRTVYVHALVRDEKGKKMSKSLGNVIDPIELIDTYGADAVRFTLAAMAALGRDLRLSRDRVVGYRNFGTKLWNAHRFAAMNGAFAAGPAPDEPPPAREAVNRWILGEAARAVQETDEALTAFRFDAAAQGLYAFVWGRVCDWYVEFSKPLLAEGHPAAAETRATLAWVLDRCLRLLHPFMPFVTEALWTAAGPRPTLLAHTPWPEDRPEALVDPEAEAEMRWAISLIEGVRSARAELNVPVGLHVPLVMTEAEPRARAALARNEALIRRLARIGEIAEGPAPRGAVTVPTQGAVFALPLADIIDVAAETERLSKGLDKLGREIASLRGRLGNAGFLASAAEDVVDETRATLAAREAEAAQLRAALERLRELA